MEKKTIKSLTKHKADCIYNFNKVLTENKLLSEKEKEELGDFAKAAADAAQELEAVRFKEELCQLVNSMSRITKDI